MQADMFTESWTKEEIERQREGSFHVNASVRLRLPHDMKVGYRDVLS